MHRRTVSSQTKKLDGAGGSVLRATCLVQSPNHEKDIFCEFSNYDYERGVVVTTTLNRSIARGEIIQYTYTKINSFEYSIGSFASPARVNSVRQDGKIEPSRAKRR